MNGVISVESAEMVLFPLPVSVHAAEPTTNNDRASGAAPAAHGSGALLIPATVPEAKPQSVGEQPFQTADLRSRLSP